MKRPRQLPRLVLSRSLHLILISFFFITPANAQDISGLEAEVAALFERSCARVGCHAAPIPQMNLDLSREQFYAGLVGEASVGKPDEIRVDPGNPDGSYLLKKMRGEEGIVGMQMPMIGDKLPEDEIQLVADWIAGLGDVDEGRKAATPEQATPPFNGWKMVNLPTNRMVPKGDFLFLIGHRFNPRIKDGYDAFFGLDGSGIILMSLGYAFSDNFLVNLGRSNADDDVELNAKYLIGQQSVGNWPVSLGVQTTLNWFSEKRPGEKRLRSEALKFSTQLMLTRAINDELSVGIVPGVLFNPSIDEEGEDPHLTLGIGGRWKFYRNFSIVAEWVPIFSGFSRTTTFGNVNRFDSWGTAFEIAVGGHVFQILVTNSVGIATDQYLRGGDLDIQDGDTRLGFNIFRILN